MQNPDGLKLYELVKQGLTEIGYKGNLIQENYEFADILADEYAVSTLPLAAFAQEPPSYRNACFGVVFANGVQGIPLVEQYRSLGAPQILELHQGHLVRWKMSGREAPVPLEQIELNDAQSLFEKNKEHWAPSRILRAKSAGIETPHQLDFFDLGLLPLLEHEARDKLDSILGGTVELAVREFGRHSQFFRRLLSLVVPPSLQISCS